MTDPLWLPADDPLVDEFWQDAPPSLPARELLLETAQDECIAYVGRSRVPAVIPARFKVALLLHARAIQRSATAGSGDVVGPDGFAVTVYPMDNNVKARLRPRRGARRVQ